MLEELFERTSRQIEAEDQFADLIESVYLAGIITGEVQALAYLWLANNHHGIH